MRFSELNTNFNVSLGFRSTLVVIIIIYFGPIILAVLRGSEIGGGGSPRLKRQSRGENANLIIKHTTKSNHFIFLAVLSGPAVVSLAKYSQSAWWWCTQRPRSWFWTAAGGNIRTMFSLNSSLIPWVISGKSWPLMAWNLPVGNVCSCKAFLMPLSALLSFVAQLLSGTESCELCCTA